MHDRLDGQCAKFLFTLTEQVRERLLYVCKMTFIIGEKLVSDCLVQGKENGFKILQFNAVVKSNLSARHLYKKLGFVELLTDGAYYMPDIQLLVGRSSTEAERKRRERLRLQAQKLLSNAKADICPPENRDKEIREQKCARTNIRTYEVTEEEVV